MNGLLSKSLSARSICLAVIQVAIFWQVPAFSQTWTTESLVGKTSFHDGVNCHGTTLMAAGMNEHLVYADGIELRYFTETFCTPKNAPAKQGDILSVIHKDSYDHSATSLGEGKIFEKESLEGLYSVFTDKGDSSFRMTPIEDSNYFRNCTENCKVQIYSCPKIADPAQLCSDTSLQLITNLRRKFEALTFNPEPNATLDEESRILLAELVESLRRMNGKEKCALLTLVRASSTFGQIYVFGFNMRHVGIEGAQPPILDEEWRALIDRLAGELKTLRKKILEQDSSAQTARILQEPSWTTQ